MHYAINLLPWREQRSVRLRRRLLMCSTGVAVLLLVIQVTLYFVLQQESDLIGQQMNASRYRQHQLHSQHQILQSIHREYLSLRYKASVLAQLRQQNNQVLYVMNVLPRLLPQDMVLNRIDWQLNQITLKLNAVKSAEIGHFIRQLEREPLIERVLLGSLVEQGKKQSRELELSLWIKGEF
ncbi:hypothetical protein F9817_03640 [Vibrio sp. CAIM 722]|uniref:Uncharacterized protein n=1 Tax=Vibrio eleionomae TaxID=2653505 RepID=A0A7X4LI16_9VIBR|nr:PilN domain-containing protein [Vibrio eleionomae]MZI92299.1 hypothetical protein [Vibrio eleionomae]